MTEPQTWKTDVELAQERAAEAERIRQTANPPAPEPDPDPELKRKKGGT